MSATTRWILGILLILTGIGIGAVWVFSGGIATIGCVEVPPDYAYVILLIGGVANVVGGILPAVMLIRQSRGRNVVIALTFAVIISCAFYVAYFQALSGSC